MSKVKGFCPECNAWRAFIITHVDHRTQMIFAIGSIPPVETVYMQGVYYGDCSRGHKTPFHLFEKPMPVRYKREPIWLYRAGRGEKDVVDYSAWLLKHRNWMREDHFHDPDHDCTTECPEFDWSVYDDYE